MKNKGALPRHSRMKNGAREGAVFRSVNAVSAR